MSRIILPTRTIDAAYAEVSVATGRFVALLVSDMSAAEIVAAFSGVESFEVESDIVPHKEYDGYTVFDSLNTRPDGILIRLRKEG